jgi:hypothetical protein
LDGKTLNGCTALSITVSHRYTISSRTQTEQILGGDAVRPGIKKESRRLGRTVTGNRNIYETIATTGWSNDAINTDAVLILSEKIRKTEKEE